MSKWPGPRMWCSSQSSEGLARISTKHAPIINTAQSHSENPITPFGKKRLAVSVATMTSLMINSTTLPEYKNFCAQKIISIQGKAIKRDMAIEIETTSTRKLRLGVGDRPEIKSKNKAASAAKSN